MGQWAFLPEEPGWGQGQLLRPGKHVLVVAAGQLVYESIEAAETLEKSGIFVGVYDPCFLKPFDPDPLYEYAKWCQLVLTVEENAASGGLGQTVAALLAQVAFPGRVLSLTIPDEFIEHGDQRGLRTMLGLDAQGITHVIRAALR